MGGARDPETGALIFVYNLNCPLHGKAAVEAAHQADASKRKGQ